MNIHEMHPLVLGMLADAIVRLLLILFERSQ